jgi:hypothetical protein
MRNGELREDSIARGLKDFVVLHDNAEGELGAGD